MATFVGEIHSSALGLNAMAEALSASAVKGSFEGQEVDLHPESESMLASAYAMDDCPTDSRVHSDKLSKRDIQDKKKASEKQKLLTHYVKRLDQHRSTQQYGDYERRLHRLKQQIATQNQQFAQGGGAKKLTYDGEDLAKYLLSNISLDFDEVTDQDNMLEYLQAAEDFESEVNKDEIAACKKMLKRLEGGLKAQNLSAKAETKYREKMAEFMKRIRSLEEQIYFSSGFKEALKAARRKLRKAHEKEIEDGYNLIPKAADLLRGPMNIGGRQFSAVDIAAIYRDKILHCNNFLEAFSEIMSIFSSRGRGSKSGSKNQSSERETETSTPEPPAKGTETSIPKVKPPLTMETKALTPGLKDIPSARKPLAPTRER